MVYHFYVLERTSIVKPLDKKILSAIEFAANHRKPFLKNFINLVLPGKFTEVRPAKQIKGISYINEFTTPTTTTTLNTTNTTTISTITIDNNQNCNNTKNGIIIESSSSADTINNCLSATEEVSQDTDSSVEEANSNKSKTTNSIAIGTPKIKVRKVLILV